MTNQPDEKLKTYFRVRQRLMINIIFMTPTPKLLEVESLVMPCCFSSHWILIVSIMHLLLTLHFEKTWVIKPHDKTTLCFDSYGGYFHEG